MGRREYRDCPKTVYPREHSSFLNKVSFCSLLLRHVRYFLFLYCLTTSFRLFVTRENETKFVTCGGVNDAPNARVRRTVRNCSCAASGRASSRRLLYLQKLRQPAEASSSRQMRELQVFAWKDIFCLHNVHDYDDGDE